MKSNSNLAGNVKTQTEREVCNRRRLPLHSVSSVPSKAYCLRFTLLRLCVRARASQGRRHAERSRRLSAVATIKPAVLSGATRIPTHPHIHASTPRPSTLDPAPFTLATRLVWNFDLGPLTWQGRSRALPAAYRFFFHIPGIAAPQPGQRPDSPTRSFSTSNPLRTMRLFPQEWQNVVSPSRKGAFPM